MTNTFHGLPELSTSHPVASNLSASWQILNSQCSNESNQHYPHGNWLVLPSTQHTLQHYPEAENLQKYFNSHAQQLWAMYPKYKVHVALLNIKWIKVYEKIALKVNGVSAKHGNVIVLSAVNVIIVDLFFGTDYEISISDDSHCGSWIMLKKEFYIVLSFMRKIIRYLQLTGPYFGYSKIPPLGTRSDLLHLW